MAEKIKLFFFCEIFSQKKRTYLDVNFGCIRRAFVSSITKILKYKKKKKITYLR